MTPQRKERISSVLAKRQNDITVVLENVFDPHNISAVMRSCDAVGVQEIFVLILKYHYIKNGVKGAVAAPLNGSQFINSQTYLNAFRC